MQAFCFSSTLTSTILEFGSLLIFNRFGLNVLPSGPYTLIFSILYQFSRLVPQAYSFRIFGVTVTNKVFMYILALQVSPSHSRHVSYGTLEREILARDQSTSWFGGSIVDWDYLRPAVPRGRTWVQSLSPAPRNTALHIAIRPTSHRLYEAASAEQPCFPRRSPASAANASSAITREHRGDGSCSSFRFLSKSTRSASARNRPACWCG